MTTQDVWEQTSALLTWLLSTTGPPVVVLGVLGYMFREKWKQLLTRTLAHDLERLKADLQREAAIHAASLAPQLEQIKAEFQQRVEAYKVSLIAQSEQAKAQSELKKSIAIKFASNEFDRLVELEAALVAGPAVVVAMGTYPLEVKSMNDAKRYFELSGRLDVAIDGAGMFLEPTLGLTLRQLAAELNDYAGKYIGPGRPLPEEGIQEGLLKKSSPLITQVRVLIKAIGKL